MPLSDYQPPKETVKFPGGEFQVRGIALKDVAILFETNRHAVDEIYVTLAAREGQEINEATVVEVVRNIVEVTPSLVAAVIALAADEYTKTEIVGQLPVPVQIEALEAIGRLTFVDLAGAKKFVAGIVSILRNMIPNPQTMTASPNGILSSATSPGTLEPTPAS